MPVVVIEPATVQPVTLAEAKRHLRVVHTEDDELISAQIAAASATVEHWLSRALVEQTLELRLDEFPTPSACSGVVILPRGPVQSIESVIYLDIDEAEQTIAAEDYRLDTSIDRYGRVWPLDAWPSAWDAAGTVRFRYVAGYPLAGEGEPTTPAPIRAAINMYVAHLYANAESVATGAMMAVPMGVQDLVAPYRVVMV